MKSLAIALGLVALAAARPVNAGIERSNCCACLSDGPGAPALGNTALVGLAGMLGMLGAATLRRRAARRG